MVNLWYDKLGILNLMLLEDAEKAGKKHRKGRSSSVDNRATAGWEKEKDKKEFLRACLLFCYWYQLHH